MKYFLLIKDDYVGDFYLHAVFGSKNDAVKTADSFVGCERRIVEGNIIYNQKEEDYDD